MKIKNINNIVYCPNCNKRLFDILKTSDCFIEIKCPKCKNIVRIKLSENIIK